MFWGMQDFDFAPILMPLPKIRSNLAQKFFLRDAATSSSYSLANRLQRRGTWIGHWIVPNNVAKQPSCWTGKCLPMKQ